MRSGCYQGGSLLGVMVAIAVLGAFGMSISSSVAASQSSRIKHAQRVQAFYSARGGLEYAFGQIKTGGNPNPIATRYFNGAAITFSRMNQKVSVSAAAGDAIAAYQVDDPASPSVSMIE